MFKYIINEINRLRKERKEEKELDNWTYPIGWNWTRDEEAERLKNESVKFIESLKLKYFERCSCYLKLNKCLWPGQCENDKMITMFGKTEEEIRQCIAFSEACGDTFKFFKMHNKIEKNKPLTRKEATEKILNLGYENGMLITALEALGLIKFDDDDEKEQYLYYDNWNKRLPMKEVVYALNQAGYNVVKY